MVGASRVLSISCAIILCLQFAACGGGSSSRATIQPPSPAPTPIPQSPASVFFGMHQSHMEACPGTASNLSFPLFDASAGTFRIWGTCSLFWANMDPGDGTYDFTGLDSVLAALYTKGINDVFISLGRVPPYISSNRNDAYCDAANQNGQPTGMCDPPTDINSDGSGSDAAWRNFMAALVKHASDSTYLQSHAHILYYEIWSEFHRSDTLNSGYSCGLAGSGNPTCAFRGTFAQMLRMTQDMRCIVEGNANDPITGLNTTCRADPSMPARGVDPAAKVMEGDAGPGSTWNPVMQNYLYCNADPPSGSQCTWSPANPLGSNSTDVISGHPYFNNGRIPEDAMADTAMEMAVLSTSDAAKPFFAGEGSWGKNNTVNDPTLQAAYVPRWYITQLMLNVSRAYWFAWDEFEDTGNGGLWSPGSLSFPPLQCTTGDSAGGYYCTGGVSYIWTVNWLSGATVTGAACPGSCTNPAHGIFSLSITRPGGYQAQIVWDSTPTNTCSNVVCGITAPGAVPFAAAQWRDLTGSTHSGPPAMVGASPIIVENMTPPSS